MIPTWTIWLDGAAYSGETTQQEHAAPTAGRGWTGKQTEHGTASASEVLRLKSKARQTSDPT